MHTINTANNWGYSRKSAFLTSDEILSQSSASPAWTPCKAHCSRMCSRHLLFWRSLRIAQLGAANCGMKCPMDCSMSLLVPAFSGQNLSLRLQLEMEIMMASTRKGFQGLECVPVPGGRAWNTSATPSRWSGLTPPDYPIRSLDKQNSLKNPCNDVAEL